MTIENRRYIRFLLDVPAVSRKLDGQDSPTCIRQVSIGGCLTDWNDNLALGEEFRLEINLPNKNILPLMCKVIYRFENEGIGVKFHDICRFEQELLSQIISERLEMEGLPLMVDPFSLPPAYATGQKTLSENEKKVNEMLEKSFVGKD